MVFRNVQFKFNFGCLSNLCVINELCFIIKVWDSCFVGLCYLLFVLMTLQISANRRRSSPSIGQQGFCGREFFSPFRVQTVFQVIDDTGGWVAARSGGRGWPPGSEERLCRPDAPEFGKSGAITLQSEFRVQRCWQQPGVVWCGLFAVRERRRSVAIRFCTERSSFHPSSFLCFLLPKSSLFIYAFCLASKPRSKPRSSGESFS